MNPLERFMAKVALDEDAACWRWTGHLGSSGYGSFFFEGHRWGAHRWSMQNIGQELLLSGLVIDHLCRNRACVNPAHMEQVTNRVNLLRGHHPNVLLMHGNQCSRGHELSADNAYIRANGTRQCKQCTRLRRQPLRDAS